MIINHYFSRNCNVILEQADYLHFSDQVEAAICKSVSGGKNEKFNRLTRSQKRQAFIKSRQCIQHPAMMKKIYYHDYIYIATQIRRVLTSKRIFFKPQYVS